MAQKGQQPRQDDRDRLTREIEDLRSAIEELAAKVTRLVDLQTGRKPTA